VTEPERPAGVHPPMRRLNPTVLALLAGLVVVLLLIAYFASNRNPDQDKLKDTQVTTAQPAVPERRCASQSTYDLVKRELFRRAAQLRGSDQAAYDRLSAYAVVRMENPVLESQDKDTGAVNCSASLSLDLPPGVAAVGGRRTLMSDLDYTVQPAADGTGMVVLLRNADPIIAPLATLARVAQPAPAPVAQSETNAIGPEAQQQAAPVAPAAPSAPAPPARPAGARPSFDCANARTRGEIAVCSDAGLATLDRNMAAQFGRAMANASPEEQALLRRTRDRFLGYRDRCPDNRCIGNAYVGRMREIRDIMEGRWQAPR
jgi:hypothetical protein